MKTFEIGFWSDRENRYVFTTTVEAKSVEEAESMLPDVFWNVVYNDGGLADWDANDLTVEVL